MRSRVHGQQALLAYMSVDLCRLQAGVPQQFLHHPEVGAPVQEVGGEAVAEGVGVGRDRRSPVEHPSDVTGPQPMSPPVEEQGLSWAFLRLMVARGPSSQAATASAQRAWISTWRCLDPLPVTVTTRRPRSTSPRSRPHSSATRIPLPYSSSSTASSRRATSGRTPAAAPPAGSSSCPSSWWPRTRGSRESGDGADSRTEGSSVDDPPLGAPLEVGAERRRRPGDGGLGVAPGGQIGQVPAQDDPVHVGRALGTSPPGPLGEPLDVATSRPGPRPATVPPTDLRNASISQDTLKQYRCHRAESGIPGPREVGRQRRRIPPDRGAEE